MLNIRSHIITLLLIVVPGAAFSKTFTGHGVGGYVSGGYHTELMPRDAQLSRPNGLVAGLGFDYRLTVYRSSSVSLPPTAKFLLNTGVGFTLRHIGFMADASEIYLPHSIDSDHHEFTYIYQMSDRSDRYTSLYAVVPLMVGAEFRHFYFSVGAKLNLALSGRSNTHLKVASYGDYPQFLDPFTSMPEHQFFDSRDLQVRQKASATSDITASVELGYLLSGYNEYDSSSAGFPEIRLAIFADYGVASFGKAASGSLPAIQTPNAFSDTQDMFSPIRVNPALSTTLAGTGRRAPLSVGVRLIVTIPYRASSHFPCKCIEGED